MRLIVGILVVAVLGVAFVFHERRGVLQRELAAVATQLAGRPVHVRCPGLASDVVDVSPEAGSVPAFDANGRPGDYMNLKRPMCDALNRFPHDLKGSGFACVFALSDDCSDRIWDDVQAVHVIAHESWHLRGVGNEAITECRSVQTTAFAATLFGADQRTAQAIATFYWQKTYPHMPDDYRTPLCANGGPLDLR